MENETLTIVSTRITKRARGIFQRAAALRHSTLSRMLAWQLERAAAALAKRDEKRKTK